MTTSDWLPAVATKLSQQRDAISRRQAVDEGMPASTIQRYVQNGRWQREYPGVFIGRERPGDDLQRLWAAKLAVGDDAVVSFEAAAALHRFEGYERGPLVFTGRHGSHRRLAGVFVHQIDDVEASHVTTYAGLAVTSPARTAADMAAKLSEQRLSLLVQHAVVSGRFELPELARIASKLLRPGKPGAKRLGFVLDELFSGERPGESWLEQVLINALAAAGGPQLHRQAAHPARSLPHSVVDLMTVDGTKMIIEADGRNFHGRLRDMARDRERDLSAAAAGYITLRVTWEQLRYKLDQTMTDILDVHRLRLSQSRALA